MLMKRESRGGGRSRVRLWPTASIGREEIDLAGMAFLSLEGRDQKSHRSFSNRSILGRTSVPSIAPPRHPQLTDRAAEAIEAVGEAEAGKQSCQTHAERETEMDERTARSQFRKDRRPQHEADYAPSWLS